MMNETQKAAIATAIKTARENLPMTMDLFALAAQESMLKFKAYKQAGFSDSQAMQLLCAAIQVGK